MYEKKISSKNPGLICGILDDSGSTEDKLSGTTDSIFEWIARYFGIILMELLARSTAIQGQQAVIKPRYHNSFVLYGSAPKIWGEPVMDIETAVNRFQKEDNPLGLCAGMGGTDALAAFEKMYDILKESIERSEFCNSFPPMVFHMTDGLSSTDATPAAEKIKQLKTGDGNVLIVNAFIGTSTNLEYTGPTDFPGYLDESEAGPSPDNIRLFHMSSEMPDTVFNNLVEDGIFPKLRQGSRLFFDVRTKEMLKHVIQVVGSIGSRTERTER